jgi:hypothetical protein
MPNQNGPGAPLRQASRSPALLAAYFTVALRLAYSGLAALFTPHLNLDARLIESNRLTEQLMQPSEGLRYAWLGVWERFDTLWYIHIAQHGYDRPDAVGFFPLYPLLLRVVSWLIDPLAAALLVSTLAAFFLFWGFQKLLRLDRPAEDATRALLLYAAWPASFIFFCGYAESLVVALLIWSIYFARTGRWWCSGITGCLAGLSKAVGWLAIVPQAVLGWRQRKWRALAAGLTLVGPGAFALWLKLSGRMLPSEAYPRYWLTDTAPPWTTLWDSVGAAVAGRSRILEVHLLVLAVVAVLALWRNLRPEYTLYAALALCFILTKHADPTQQPWTRYVLILFTAPANLAAWLRNGTALTVGTLLLFLANVLFLRLFLGWSLVV